MDGIFLTSSASLDLFIGIYKREWFVEIYDDPFEQVPMIDIPGYSLMIDIEDL